VSFHDEMVYGMGYDWRDRVGPWDAEYLAKGVGNWELGIGNLDMGYGVGVCSLTTAGLGTWGSKYLLLGTAQVRESACEQQLDLGLRILNIVIRNG
jgi:hypothetical protein